MDLQKPDVINSIIKHKIVAIIRKINPEYYSRTIEALYKGGIRLIEVTFDPAEEFSKETTIEQIRYIAEHYKGQVLAGAGTVLSTEQVDAAFHAGAKFIISPNVEEAVIRRSTELGLISVPGALTPTEAVYAKKIGADFVKLFPAGDMCTTYIKSIMAPLSHIKFIAVGSIDADNLSEFLKTGIVGAGVGSSLVNKKLIKEEKYDELTKLALKFTSQI
jgi:2-dehydro-3-deoxyphosphogluconate aldolase/(4S)-4-hydroxy-2-oxoglutarate aldolase